MASVCIYGSLQGAGNRDYCAVATQGVSKRNPCWPGWRPAGGRGQCAYACHRALESSVAQTDACDYYNKIVQLNSTYQQHSTGFRPNSNRASHHPTTNVRLFSIENCLQWHMSLVQRTLSPTGGSVRHARAAEDGTYIWRFVVQCRSYIHQWSPID